MKPSTLAVTAIALLAPLAAAEDHTLITWKTQQLSNEFYAEGAAVGDLNRDGKMDVVSGPFWYAGPDVQQRHVIYPPKPFDPHRYSDNFFTFTSDINGDGWTDVLVYGFPGKDASWYENPQHGKRPWQRHVVLDVVDNESPLFTDITGDGKPEVVCSQGGYFGFAEPNREHPEKPWKFRRISDKSAGGRFTHGLGVGDVNGDRRPDLLEKSGWWEQPASLDGDPQWKKHAVAFSGPGGAQMYAYDVDGDGDNDVITSLAAHGYGLAWYENAPAGEKREFKPHLIMGDKPEKNRYGVTFSQLHAVAMADIDGDGIQDIVTGKRYWAHGPKGDAEPGAPAVVYWFRIVRTGKGSGPDRVDFIPHQVHDDSGVGTDVVAQDVSGDGYPDIVVGNKKGTHVSIQSRRQVSEAQWRKAQPKPLSAATSR